MLFNYLLFDSLIEDTTHAMSKVTGVSILVVVRKNNRSMAEQAMKSIVNHRPIFTLCHNIYGFDNKVLAIVLGSSHPMVRYFEQTTRRSTNSVIDITRCDWRPECFNGGELVYTGPTITSNVMTADFISIYLSIMASCGVSPEIIDYVTPSYFQTCRFDDITTIGKYTVHNNAWIVILIICGTISRKVNTPNAHHILGELCNVLDVKKYSADSISASCNIVNDIEK